MSTGTRTQHDDRMTLARRACGVLLHPTSLPGPYGIGDLGPAAFRFADQLAAAGQSWWQMLPICPAGAGDSPYSSDSGFAGSALLISPDRLMQQGLLTHAQVRGASGPTTARVSYAGVMRRKSALLRAAFATFCASGGEGEAPFKQFVKAQALWLDEHCLFRAIKQAQGGRPWYAWPAPLRRREASALDAAREELGEAIAIERFVQVQFDQQWHELRDYAASEGVGLLGDLPIFVAHDSADVWAQRELFQVGSKGELKRVSGAPPDAYAPQGQKWGHPLYAWRAHEAEGLAWWVARIANALQRFDAVRIDHFLGLARCWTVKADEADARRGRWQSSSGAALLARVIEQISNAQLIADDLGLPSPQAWELRERFRIPGMRLLLDGFGDGGGYHLPHRHVRRCVAYTGTHDTDTAVGWFRKCSADERRRVLALTQCRARDLHLGLMRLAYSSVADTVIVPAQDVLGLGTRARMNVPGTPTGNWRWRLGRDMLPPETIKRVRELAMLYERA